MKGTWVYHCCCSFCWFTFRYDPIPIHRYTIHMIILSMYRQVWPNPIPNSNTWVHHPYDYFVNLPSDMTQSNTQLQYISIPPIWSCWRCTARYDPIQYPIPIHRYTTHMIILSMYRQVWPNPIPNSNTCVHHPFDHLDNVPSDMTQSNTQFQHMGIPPPWSFCQCTVRYDPIQYPIPIHEYTTPMINMSMYHQIWPRTTPHAKAQEHHPREQCSDGQ